MIDMQVKDRKATICWVLNLLDGTKKAIIVLAFKETAP